jgi:hypothetical protein
VLRLAEWDPSARTRGPAPEAGAPLETLAGSECFGISHYTPPRPLARMKASSFHPRDWRMIRYSTAVSASDRTSPKLECPECRSAKVVIIKDQPWNRLAFCPACEHVWNHTQARRTE